MEALLNFDEPVDVGILERVLHCVNESKSDQDRSKAQVVLMKFKNHPNSWRQVNTILERSSNPHTRFFALSILGDLIQFRWLEIGADQRRGIRGFLITIISNFAKDFDLLHQNAIIVKKLNLLIVEVAKHEWPANWPSFIPDLVSSAKKSESICENNITILQLLSEEVFDYSAGKMTQKKIQHLKSTMTSEFQEIFKLCLTVLTKAQRPSLLLITLQTLLGFLNWIPIGYIFETPLVPLLVQKFFPPSPSRPLTLQCLTEIAALSVGSRFNDFFVKLFTTFMTELNKIIPPKANIPQAYRNGKDHDKKFIHFLVLFLATLFKSHLKQLENLGQPGMILRAHEILAIATMLDDDTLFNICLDYWNGFASDLYHDSVQGTRSAPAFDNADSSIAFPEDEDDGSLRRAPSFEIQESTRAKAYSSVLAKVRTALILRMPKPEEVLIVEDDYGKIIREQTVDTAALAIYKTMRSTLIFLTHLDPQHTQNLITERLKEVCYSERWTYASLNTLCWAVGSISGALNEHSEKGFLVLTIKELLVLVEKTKIKDAKAVIASNIMYIVGQYPRFLRAHWRFLRTVVKKLFEFMHEFHPGVQDMACDTFLKIAKRCRRKFVQPQEDENGPFIQVILTDISATISDLNASQIQVFYEAVGCMIQSHPDQRVRGKLVDSLMALPNKSWREAIRLANDSIESLRSVECANTLAAILKTNERVCFSVGQSFSAQMARMFQDMLHLYKTYSGFVTKAVTEEGAEAIHFALVRAIRSTKKEVLRLVETFVMKTNDPETISSKFVPPILEAVLGDYHRSHPDARDAEVLSLFAAIINKLQGSMNPLIPDVLKGVFECTLAMIKKNFQDYPDHRVFFFTLLRAIFSHCFRSLFNIPKTYFKMIVDSIVWATRHTLRPVSETGLLLMQDLWRNMAKSGAASAFFSSFYIKLFSEVFYVLTDRSHKFGFALQSSILKDMIYAVQTNAIDTPIYQPEGGEEKPNDIYLKNFILNLIGKHFPNVGQSNAKSFVIGLFDHCRELPEFKTHLRDFLVQLQEFSPDDNQDLDLLYSEENEAKEKMRIAAERRRNMRIPGMIAPASIEDSMMED